MVVCKCRKATKLYCFVHKVPVCGECVCLPEHQLCVIRTYSEWVIDGDYDWPPTCCLCKSVLEDGSESQTTRLGCLHVIHTNCFISHVNSYPQNTAPAGYACPACSVSIWPPKSIKDSGSLLHSKLKESIMKTGLEKNLFGNHPVSLSAAESNGPPPAFASDPLAHIYSSGERGKSNANTLDSSEESRLSSSIAQDKKYMPGGYPPSTGTGSSELSATGIVEVDGANSRGSQLISDHGPNFMKGATPVTPGATTRKGPYQVERQNSEISYYADDEDGNQKKYTRRGPLRHKLLRTLLPFWSSAMPTLPVTAPPRKEASHTDDALEGRSRHKKSSKTDARKILLIMAIMACMATMVVLYYRLAQRGFGETESSSEQQ